jgi:hypothetical protein
MKTRSLTTNDPPELTHDQIAIRAHELWESEGRPQNKDLQFWLRAEAELALERETKLSRMMRVDPKTNL